MQNALAFADDTAPVAVIGEELQAKVLSWQRALGEGGMKMNVVKSEVMVLERSGET